LPALIHFQSAEEAGDVSGIDIAQSGLDRKCDCTASGIELSSLGEMCRKCLKQGNVFEAHMYAKRNVYLTGIGNIFPL